MDPLTAFVIATLMMLLNGGVLGLMHRDLAESLQPSAASWRISTLLVAAGCVLLAVQRQLPPGFVLPLANGLLMLGVTGYWHALRQFYAYPLRWALLLPVLGGILGIAWYTSVQPDFVMRVLIATLVWCIALGGCIWTLRASLHDDPAVSRRVLAATCGVVAVFMLARAIYVLSFADASGSVIEASSWVNMVTPMVAAVLPVVGTTAFLLLCSERLRRQWERAASIDALTGLPNRRTLAAAGERRLRQRDEGVEGVLAVALIDIDHFKSINDRYGHDIGDLALKHVAERLREACSATDMAARLGGEEFVVLLARGDAAAALAGAEALRVAVSSAPCTFASGSIVITASIGLCLHQASDAQLDDLLRRADQALYRAKQAGRNRVELAAADAAVG